MNLQKLNPWNWFKHEEGSDSNAQHIPVKRVDREQPTQYQESSHPMMKLHHSINRLFDDVFKGFGKSSLSPSMSNWFDAQGFRPNLNISGDDNNYQVTLDAPGLTESDISIEVKGDVLTIQGHKQEEIENKDRHFYRIERNYGAFQRTLSLPDDVNTDQIQASMKNGVLNLVIPRRETVNAEVRRIPIN